MAAGMSSTCVARLNKELRQLVRGPVLAILMCLRCGPAPCVRRCGQTMASLAWLMFGFASQELEPPPGVSAWPRDGKINALEAGAHFKCEKPPSCVVAVASV